jgi:hypothetical protein
MKKLDRIWWFKPVIPGCKRLRQKGCEFKASLVHTVRPYVRKNKKGGREQEREKKARMEGRRKEGGKGGMKMFRLWMTL